MGKEKTAHSSQEVMAEACIIQFVLFNYPYRKYDQIWRIETIPCA